ncbi:hypothetical protein [Bradyrhizobium sp. WSM2254]|uniref:hypothetical protein n=1 Tax=Bradyrhizobium sp. WSM2254 TaxID=1188263 RepID=UPI000417F3B7|nr:hypothetical protein [Bradyrhizobium sp. WSM2254]
MRTRTILLTLLFPAIAAGVSTASALTQDELIDRIQAAGYTQVSEIKSTAEGTTAKALKNGKPVRLLVDGAGQIREQN